MSIRHGVGPFPDTERAAALRRAGGLCTRHAEDIQQWLVREAGGIPGEAATRAHFPF